jgi:phytol kinase
MKLSRYLAAIIPLMISLQFLLVGLGIMKDQASVDAMTRRGDRREILRGPLIYGIAFVLLTMIYWKNSATGITALMMLSGGDGLADIIGKRFGKTRLAWSPNKTWAGSVAMFLEHRICYCIYLFAAVIHTTYSNLLLRVVSMVVSNESLL